MHVDTLWSNVHLMTLDGEGLGVLRDAVLAATDGRIVKETALQPGRTTRDVLAELA